MGHAAVTIIAACGTGKTLIGKRIAEHFAQRGPVLVLVPTLDLLTQTAARWLADGSFDQLIGVCSLPGVHDRSLRGHLLLTADAQVLARRVALGGRIAVFATYSSLPTIQRAHRDERLRRWSFALADEAHRTSGDWDNRWALIHDDRAIPAAHRLYMTATPRTWRTTQKSWPPRARVRIERLASMDDPTIYGPEVYRLDLAEAIERGILADYQLIVPEVHDSMFRRILHERLPTPHQDGLRLTAMQAALLMSMAEHDVRRVLSFHGRIAAARGFVASLPETADVLADRTGIRNPWAQALYCNQAPWKRQQIFHEFEHFSAHTPGSTAASHDCAVLASVRVLSEGVDVPDTDGILIADPRRSPNSIAQSIGRALRKPPGQAKCASIFIPVYIAPGESTQEGMNSSPFSDFWRFFNGLAVYDTRAYRRFSSRKKKQRLQPLPPRPHRAGEVIRTLKLRTHKAPNSAFWNDGLQAAQAFRVRHGHLNVPSEHVTGDGLAMGQWIGQQRSLYAAGALSADRIAALTSMGVSWPHPPESFEYHLAQITACATRHGTLALGKNAHGGDRRLAAWLETMRCRADTGQLAPARVASLNAIDPFWNPPWGLRWQYTYAQIRRRLTTSTWRCTYHRHDSCDSAWDSWLDRQITHSHQLDPQQKHLLAALARACPDAHPHSMLLTRPSGLRERAFNRGLGAARQYHQRHGHLDMPKDHIEEILGDKVHLGPWLIRRGRDSAQMTPRQRAALEALGFEPMPVFLPPAQPLRDAAA